MLKGERRRFEHNAQKPTVPRDSGVHGCGVRACREHPSALQQTSSVAVAAVSPARYRARSPRVTPLYRLFEARFNEVRGTRDRRSTSQRWRDPMRRSFRGRPAGVPLVRLRDEGDRVRHRARRDRRDPQVSRSQGQTRSTGSAELRTGRRSRGVTGSRPMRGREGCERSRDVSRLVRCYPVESVRPRLFGTRERTRRSGPGPTLVGPAGRE